MKNVAIIGIGMNADTVTREGLRAIERSDVLFGAPRMLGAFSHLEKPSFPVYEPAAIKALINESALSNFAVLVSGDTGFFSAAKLLVATLSELETTLFPGISSVSYFFAKLKRCWQDAVLISCHGREGNLVDAVRRNRMTFALTGDNVNTLAARLSEAGYGDLPITVGVTLGSQDEHIFTLPAAELVQTPVRELSVLLIENSNADARVRFGIPDGEFARGDVPMTKSEVRAVSLSRLALSPNDVCCDIGAGTGSVTVEMAMAVYKGRVYSIEKSKDAISLLKENCKRFHLGNVTPIFGSAPEALSSLSPINAAFIGGSSGAMKEIVAAVLSKNPFARIVVNAIALETLHAAVEAFKQYGITPEIVQIGSARSKPAGDLNMMLAQNPVFIVSGGGKP